LIAAPVRYETSALKVSEVDDADFIHVAGCPNAAETARASRFGGNRLIAGSIASDSARQVIEIEAVSR